ncbi:neural-cadherin-like [Schistocerca americana]|uniref:neural-cadherin-like n=1 Tax=Schistocerca americana TaxID=7009 RepID=UPI001F4F39C8|nr:neural-cadherin-like [Schistocerca americana]
MPATPLREVAETGGGVLYEIDEGNEDGVFEIDPETGDVTVAGQLDFETRPSHELQLSATAGGRVVARATLLVRLLDANDQPPVFQKALYRAQIAEEEDPANLPRAVLTVRAVDGDRGRPGSIVYSASGPGVDAGDPEGASFRIDPRTGEIFVLRPLDRDPPAGRSLWRLTAFAQDEEGTGLVGYTDVHLQLTDVNDNAPAFPEDCCRAEVVENAPAGTFVMNMTAVDTDDMQQGGNAKIRYSIEKNAIDDASGNSIFEINPTTGEIRTAICCLDRERTAYYSIQVVASDGGGLKGTGDVMILVKDINDSPPEFTNNEWFTELDETEGDNVTDEPILTVTVLDQDDGSKFQYEIIRGSGYGANKFIITANSDGTGTIRAVEPLDYEDIHGNTLRFKIQVTDKDEDNMTSEYHTSYSWVTIKLKDVNDNKPAFDVPYTEVSVAEDAKVGLSVHSFTARDPDNNGKSKVFYLVDHSLDPMRHFNVDQNGTVVIQRQLDREKTPLHEVHVLAVDDGIPAKTSTATLYVVVEDINDNFPHLLEDYKSVLPENMPPREIMKIRAADDDDYMRQNGPPFFFRMDPAADDHIHASFTVVYERSKFSVS